MRDSLGVKGVAVARRVLLFLGLVVVGTAVVLLGRVSSASPGEPGSVLATEPPLPSYWPTAGWRRERSKELEILVLRHELSILRRQVRRPPFATRDRLLLAALSRVLPRCSWHAFRVTPETLLR
jgi:hypothetical protein